MAGGRKARNYHAEGIRERVLSQGLPSLRREGDSMMKHKEARFRGERKKLKKNTESPG